LGFGPCGMDLMTKGIVSDLLSLLAFLCTLLLA